MSKAPKHASRFTIDITREEVNPCPRCASYDLYVMQGYGGLVGCDTCGFETQWLPGYSFERERRVAIDVWNRIVPDPFWKQWVRRFKLWQARRTT